MHFADSINAPYRVRRSSAAGPAAQDDKAYDSTINHFFI